MATRGIVSLVRESTVARRWLKQGVMRFYPPHYPPVQETAATMPYWIYRHMDQTQAALVEKAQDDWKVLTEDDRLRLYRHQFPVTFAEMKFPPSYGYQVYGTFIWLMALMFPFYWLVKEFVLSPAPYQMHPDYVNMLEDRVDALHKNPLWLGETQNYYDEGKLLPREGEKAGKRLANVLKTPNLSVLF